jgi:hypothetical protein
MAQVAEKDVAVSGKSKRILSFDIIRGYMLLVILVGHIELPPNFWDFFTGRGRLFVSAAEGFFFLSGLLIGMVYKRRIALGFKFILKRMLGRAAELYIASVVLTLIFAFIVAKTNHFYIKQGLPDPVIWKTTIIQTLTLRFEYGWADFLARFAILMLIAPFVFYFLMKNRWKLVLMAMVAAYLLRGNNFTLGWQFIFNGGMLIGFYWQELNKKWASLSRRTKTIAKRTTVWLAAVTFLFSYSIVYGLSELNNFYNRLGPGLQRFTINWDNFNQHIWTYADKWTMGPIRLVLFFVWAAVVFMVVARHEKPINRRTRGLLVMLGQNSLFVYIYHAFIVFVFKFFIPLKTSAIENFLIVTAALILLIGGTYFYTRFRDSKPGILGRIYNPFSRHSRSATETS